MYRSYPSHTRVPLDYNKDIQSSTSSTFLLTGIAAAVNEKLRPAEYLEQGIIYHIISLRWYPSSDRIE